MSVDGEAREDWVRSVTVEEAAKQLGVADRGRVDLRRPAAQDVPARGHERSRSRPSRTSSCSTARNPVRELQTTAVTVDELLKGENLTLGPEDAVASGTDVKLATGAEVHISPHRRHGHQRERARRPAGREDQRPEHEHGRAEGRIDPGTPGEQIATYRVTVKNGKEIGREKIGGKVTKEPKPKKIVASAPSRCPRRRGLGPSRQV